jgi:hypothetical protein
MFPDLYSPQYQRMVAEQERERTARDAHRAALHAKAVARRRKAKRGGRR